MAKYTTAELLTDDNGVPMPQYLDVTDTTGSPQGTFKPVTNVQLTGGKAVEQLTEADAVTGTLTFAENIVVIEIYNTDTVTGVFTVNGFDIHVPADKAFKAQIGGTPSPEVTITGATTYIVTRYA